MTTFKPPSAPSLSVPFPLGLSGSWQRVQAALHAHRPAAAAALDVAGLAVYHHCAHASFAQAADARRTRELLGQLIPASEQLLLDNAWDPQQFEQACALAWLQSRHAAGSAGTDMTTLLAGLDRLLEQQAYLLLEQTDSSSRRGFMHVLRYLSLRLPTASAARSLRLLLLEHPTPPPQPAIEPWLLGLPDGLAGELLLRLRLRRQGLRDEALPHHLRAGIAHLLAARRDVDFSQNVFSVFPYQIAGSTTEALFSAALTWGRGDLHQALVLYEAHELLHDDELAKIAELVGLNTLLRTTSLATEVASSRFYQGAAGVAHLYRRLYQVSGQAAYQQGYHFWLNQTQQWVHQEFDLTAAVPRAGELLHGMAGVGLVLLAATTTTDFGWDTIIL